MNTGTHQCPAGRCTRRVGVHMLMCRPHWFMVPKPLRDDVWGAWAAGMGAGSPEHAEAITAAIDAVNEKLRARDAAGRAQQAEDAAFAEDAASLDDLEPL